MERELNDDELQDLFAWIDKIPLSRPKRNISRDFSDAVMAVEVVKHFFPKLVDLHNYVPANSTSQKYCNWSLLNRKVFSKLGFNVSPEVLKKIALSTAGAVEPVLSILREKIDKKLEHTTNYMPNLDYYDTRNPEKPQAEISQIKTTLLALQPNLKKEEENLNKNMKLQHTIKFYSELDPAALQILKEKEQRLSSLQETVEILQMKVNKLEHLLHLKDMRIEDLSQNLEKFRKRENPR